MLKVFPLFVLGESRSKLGPAEGVLELALDGDSTGESLTGDMTGSNGAPILDFSMPVTASEVTLNPVGLVEDLPPPGISHSESRALTGDAELGVSRRVTVGDMRSFDGGFGRAGGLLIVLSEGVRRLPFTDKP